MADLKAALAQTNVEEGTVRVWWLGGTGFIFKTPAGTQIYIDPYLLNAVATIFGQERAFPAPIALEDVRPDLVIATHFHEDHLDPGGLPTIARVSDAVFMCPPTALSRLVGWLVPPNRVLSLERGQSRQFRDVNIQGVYARHDAGVPGWETPDAIGVILDFGGLRVYHSGDTEYDIRLRLLKSRRFDAAFVCINGVGGNMNALEAGLLVYQLGAKTVIPVHHFLWAENTAGDEVTLDPRLFEETYHKLGGTGRVVLPEVGGEIELSA